MLHCTFTDKATDTEVTRQYNIYSPSVSARSGEGCERVRCEGQRVRSTQSGIEREKESKKNILNMHLSTECAWTTYSPVTLHAKCGKHLL